MASVTDVIFLIRFRPRENFCRVDFEAAPKMGLAKSTRVLVRRNPFFTKATVSVRHVYSLKTSNVAINNLNYNDMGDLKYQNSIKKIQVNHENHNCCNARIIVLILFS
jgi:hypothetical protein